MNPLGRFAGTGAGRAANRILLNPGLRVCDAAGDVDGEAAVSGAAGTAATGVAAGVADALGGAGAAGVAAGAAAMGAGGVAVGKADWTGLMRRPATGISVALTLPSGSVTRIMAMPLETPSTFTLCPTPNCTLWPATFTVTA